MTLPVSLGAFAWSNSLSTTVLVAGGCLLGLVIEPDLDVDHVTASETRMIKLFGPLGLLWVVLWHPYAKLINHRSPLSHYPVLGTVLRYAYLLVIVLALSIPVGLVIGDGEWLIRFLSTNKQAVLLLMAGNAISDIGHWIMDQ